MREAIIKKKKYIQIPEEIETYVPDSNSVEKLSIQQCYNGKIQLHAKQWQNLRYLEIIGCSYLEISFYFPTPSCLNQIYITQCDSLDIGEILGYLPELSAWRIDNSKLIKFKGQIKGDIGLKQIEFDHVLRSEMFKDLTSLPNLEKISWENGCNFFKTDFSMLAAPKLQVLSYKDSNYLNFQSLGSITNQLTSFMFENCAYPKLNIDFKKLSQLSEESNSAQNQLSLNSDGSPISYFNPKYFREVKSVKKVRPKKKSENPFRDPNAPDIQMLRNAADPSIVRQEAEHFLNAPTHNSQNVPIPPLNDQVVKKFCPQCGNENPVAATFCSNCGESLR